AADSTVYPVLNHGRPAGEMVVSRDGATVTARYRHRDRNRGRRVETTYRLSPGGDVVGATARSFTIDGEPQGPEETFEVRADSVVWTRGDQRGAAPAGPGAFYRMQTGTPFDDARLARFLLSHPGGSADVLPGGSARVEVVADTVVATADGPERVRLAMTHGRGGSPGGVWIDGDGELFATDVAWFVTLRPGAEPALPALREIEVAYRDREAAELARRLQLPVGTALVIRGGDVFDADKGTVLPRATVVVEGDRIVAVGPDGEVAIPDGATVIDATGKSVLPGLWDMHSHFQLTSRTSASVAQLAAGLTTIRDLAADLDVAVTHRDMADAGTIVSPRVILGGFMEGPGAWAGPSEVLVRDEAEARAWVARYDSLGYRQIKLYNLVHPDLVPTIAEEAHARGMRLSGHVPRGMSVPAALRLGFDEIHHAAFLFSTFFPDSLYTPVMRPYSGVAAAVAPGFDVDGPEMTALIEDLRAHGTVVDGTFNIWMGAGVLEGSPGPASEAYGQLLRRLWDAGVTLVPGTDNLMGTTYVTELRLYEHVGIPAPEVLRMATIVSARVMGDDGDYGSVAPGKVADLIVVDGRPWERIADLRFVEHVVRAGRLYRSADLYEAVGMRVARRRAR
ncbi:MAG TPA: amidohydrolase family protein, partial [Candidatus Limnocylindrales bacterium]|nr:amidohydrolase family protein [Candidatus Limnocylindrales bacterium]